MRCKEVSARNNFREPRPSSILGSDLCAASPDTAFVHARALERTLAAQALLAAIAERGADAVGYAYRAPGDTYADGRQAAHAGVAAARAGRRAGRRDPAARPRARLHEGPSVDQRQQPSGAARAGRRHPQRDHHERRRAARPPLLRARRAADDGRLRGDLRARGPFAERRARARAPARRDGGRLARRARARRRSSSPAAAAARCGSARAATASSSPRPRHALEVVERYCALKLRKREVREGTLLALAGGSVVRRERFRPDLDYVEDDPLPAVRAPQEREFCLHAARRDRRRSERSTDAVRADRRRLPRAAARGRGTGTSPTPRGATRTCR